jgi:hypothetical protein
VRTLVWVSFDLGVKGDYEGMYEWLDSHGASECGDSVACFWYDYSRDLLTELTEDLMKSVEIDVRKNRIYVIRLVEGKMKGSFVLGHRRNAPWTGYASTVAQSEDNA